MNYVGKQKTEIVAIFGLQNNDFEDSEWKITIKRPYRGKLILRIEFDADAKIIAQYLTLLKMAV